MSDLYQDIMNIEGEAESEQEYFLSMQRLINSGRSAWALPGRNGRAMHDAIEAGRCLLGHDPASDYYGNRIPSRTEVKPGTKGSYEYVVEHSGVDWANTMRNA